MYSLSSKEEEEQNSPRTKIKMLASQRCWEHFISVLEEDINDAHTLRIVNATFETIFVSLNSQ